MQWWTLALSLSALMATLLVASTVTGNSRRVSKTLRSLSAEIAVVSGKLSQIEQAERLTPSKLAELADVRDAIGKGNALLKRINSRETMRDRHAQAQAVQAVDMPIDKAELRRRAGIVAGKPVQHSE